MKNSKSKLQGECFCKRMQLFPAAWKESNASANRENNPEICGKNIRAKLPGLGYEKRRCLPGNGPCCDYAVDPEPRWQSAPNPAGGILNLIGATRGKLCEKGRPVRGRLSQNSFIPPRHIRKYVQWPPHKICLQEPLLSLVQPDPVDRLFSELAGRVLRAHRCFHRFRPERREFRTVFLLESFCIAFPARPADAGKIIVSIPDCLILGCDGFPEIRVLSFRFRTLHADAFR